MTIVLVGAQCVPDGDSSIGAQILLPSGIQRQTLKALKVVFRKREGRSTRATTTVIDRDCGFSEHKCYKSRQRNLLLSPKPLDGG